MTKDEALKRGMELLRSNIFAQQWFELQPEINTIKEALAQPEQEPVAWMCNAFDGDVCERSNHDDCENPIPLYTTPPKREWVGLTDKEMQAVVDAQPLVSSINVYFKAIEAKLKKLNT